jgi:hypothetical protein
LVHYEEPRLAFHSIVHNLSGNVKADAAKFFNKYQFSIVPSQSFGTFILEEKQLQQKIEEICNAFML